MPKISVIVPVYNTEKYLAECLDSVLTQTFKDIEIICINDGSPDNSAVILSEYAQKDPRIRVITQENQGLSVARNAGLDAATSEWVYFLDSDDILPYYALEVLYQIAEKSGCKIIASRGRLGTAQYQAFQTEGKSVDVSFDYREWNGLKDFVRDSKVFSSACMKLYATSLFASQRFKSGMFFEDWPVITILFGQVDKYATTEMPCYVYREDNQSITRSAFSIKKIDSYIQGVRMVFEVYQNTDKLFDARKRMAVAIKMLVNRVYRSKDATLAKHLIQQMKQVFDENIILKKNLPFKTRWRLWLLKRK